MGNLNNNTCYEKGQLRNYTGNFKSRWIGPPAFKKVKPGGDLLSQGVSTPVPSALEDFTCVFGMGTGVAPPPLPPGLKGMGTHRFLLAGIPCRGMSPVLHAQSCTANGQDLGLLVPVSLMHYCTCTPGLSTMCSTWDLTPALNLLLW